MCAEDGTAKGTLPKQYLDRLFVGRESNVRKETRGSQSHFPLSIPVVCMDEHFDGESSEEGDV